MKPEVPAQLLAVFLLAVPAAGQLDSEGSSCSPRTPADQSRIVLPVAGEALLTYQAAPLMDPAGGDAFAGSNFIHPLKTPSGFTVTHSEPKDHFHHFGLWWPWKYIEFEGRKILTWELQRGDGIVEAESSQLSPDGLITHSVYIDRKAPTGPQVRLHETTRIRVSDLVPASTRGRGYYLDLEIDHAVAGKSPVTVSTYRYSGLGFRGSALWNAGNSTLLTSSGADRYDANSSAARWVRIEGTNGEDGTAGVLMMSHPANHAHPEKVRTWDTQHGGAIFVNFNPVMDQPWTFEPGKIYTRNYRLFIYDGILTAEAAGEMWRTYAAD